jgi:hypothetical protein
MELSTVSVLGAARALYRAAGFELVDEKDFDDWGPTLTEETWRLEFYRGTRPSR